MKKAQINYETLKRTRYTVWVRNYKTGPTDSEIKHVCETLWTRGKSRMDFTPTFEVCTGQGQNVNLSSPSYLTGGNTKSINKGSVQSP